MNDQGQMNMRVVLLAAGQGKRMGSEELPKVLRPFGGRPMLHHLLDAVESSGVDSKPVVVIGYLADAVRESCGDRCAYAMQEALRGTGDAVRSAKQVLGGAEHLVVLNGDMPLISGSTIRRIADTHLAANATLTLATVTVDDFEGWRATFADFGRILRDDNGDIQRIIEKKDASKEQLAIHEVNPGTYAFRTSWLWDNLEKLTTENAQGEYYLTDLLEIAIDAHEKVMTVPVAAEEALGVNTPEQLAQAEKFLNKDE